MRERAEAACARLESINAALYDSLRQDIRSGRGAGRLLQWARVLSPNASVDPQSVGPGNDYDALDELVSGVLPFGEPQVPTVDLTPEMVFYQPTPARHIFAMLSLCGLDEGDVLADLGAGLGHVPLLAAICTPARAIGVELEPAYVACARHVASALNLTNATFAQGDVRDADLSAGTVFYLYTPFKGTILRDVLERLGTEAKRRPIRVVTFGPCTPIVARESWLIADVIPEENRIALFRSIG